MTVPPISEHLFVATPVVAHHMRPLNPPRPGARARTAVLVVVALLCVLAWAGLLWAVHEVLIMNLEGGR